MLLTIPRAHRTAFVALATLSDEEFAELVAAIGSLRPYAPVPEILDAANHASESAAAYRASDVIAGLLSIRGQMRGEGVESLASGLAESPDLDLDAEARQRLEPRLVAILVTDALSTTSVAVDLQTQHARNFQSARIFTDIRPVFTDDLDDRPTGAVITETLQIQTWDRSGGSEAIFVALDEADLVALKGVVDRALKKTENLRGLLAEQDLAYFELGDSEPQ